MRRLLRRFVASVWLFPVILTAVLLMLSLLKISGSSIGIYHEYFYGQTEDRNLIANKPQAIRSDEWLVNSQLIFAQKSNGYQLINDNFGKGQDFSVLSAAPYKEWSTFFKPHNLSFLVLPFDTAFAFRWWVLAYLLVLSCYFFVLMLIPGKRLLAALIGLGFLFSPFIQWWYLAGTISIIYYGLFIAIVLIKLVNQKNVMPTMGWGLLLSYLLISFALVIYPPFQIPAALAIAAFGLGYLIEKLRRAPAKLIWQKFAILAGSLSLTVAVTVFFLVSRADVIQSITNTAYPGNRIQPSGHYSASHLFSSHLAGQFQYPAKANKYYSDDNGLVNQSETANFIFIMPFLWLPGLALLIYGYTKRRKIDWPLLITSGLFALLLIRLFVPHFNWFFKLLLLDKVPHNRLIIGLGLLGIIHTVLFIRNFSQLKRFPTSKLLIYVYGLVILAVELAIGFYIKRRFPGFVGNYRVWLLAIPIPIIVYLLLIKHFRLAMLGLLAFSIFSTFAINPLYHGTEIVTQTSLVKEIEQIVARDEGKWVMSTEGIFENFAAIAGAPSLSGLYLYPQLELWKPIDDGSQESIYNRYAHVNFALDRDPNQVVPSRILKISNDSFQVFAEPCNDFFTAHQVRFLVTQNLLEGQDNCAELINKVDYPARTFYIYRLDKLDIVN